MIVLNGMTGVGKTDISLQLAKALNAEIICADSQQMQKSASIISNKQLDTKVHLIDHYVDSRFMNANTFAKDARRLIKEIHARGKIPILEGGSTFYIKHLFEGNLNIGKILPEDL